MMKRVLLLFTALALAPASALAEGREDLSLCRSGWEATEAGNHASAIKLFRQCIGKGSLSKNSLARTYRNLGIAYRRAGEFRNAIDSYNKAIALQPNDIWNDYVNRGNARSEAGDFKNALSDYDLALRAKPNYNEAYYNRGIVFERQNETAKAKAEFIKAYEHGLRSQQLYDRLVQYGLVKG